MEFLLYAFIAFIVYTLGYNHGLNEERRKNDIVRERLLDDGVNPDDYFD